MGKKFIGVDELRKDLTKILKKLPKEKEIVITQLGDPKAILLDISHWSKMREKILKITSQVPKV